MSRFNQAEPNRAGSALLYGGFVLTGVITTLLAPLLPLLASKWSLSDAMAGYLFPAQFIGSKLGNLILSGILVHRAGFRLTLVLGYGLMCVGVGMLGLGLPWPIVLIAVFCYGSGIGITIPATNLWISEANPAKRAATLNVINLAWSIGAVLCPAAITVFHRLWGVSAFLLTVAVVAAVIAASLGCAGRFGTATQTRQGNLDSPPMHVVALLCMATLFFLYVGVENSVAGWISSLAHRLNSTSSHWMLVPSFFWGALLAGRAIASRVLRRVPELRVAMAGLVLAAIGTAVLIFTHQLSLLYVASCIAGLGLASVYPIAIASVSAAFSPRIASAMFLLSGFGGATMPWIVGMISTHVGSLRAGLVVPLVAIIAMLTLEFVLAREGRIPTAKAFSAPVAAGA